MIKQLQNTARAALLALTSLISTTAFAAGAACLPFGEAQTTPTEIASLRNGAKLYFNYCASCHSLQYMRYKRLAADLQLTEEQVLQNFAFTGAAAGDFIKHNMPPGGRGNSPGASEWFGQVPPDLSLTARSRGVDWIYNYLKGFYPDASRQVGWNNLTFANASMPNPLWELQGVQELKKSGSKDAHCSSSDLELKSTGSMNPQQYDKAVNDLTSFLQYVGEPAILARESMGVWVILYLCLLTFLLWLLKNEYWRDVH